MIDFGLPGGGAAGGLGTDPGIPAVDIVPATGVGERTGAGALDIAFRSLIEALDGSEPAEPPVETVPAVTPVFWPAGRALPWVDRQEPSDELAAVPAEPEAPEEPRSKPDDPHRVNIVVPAPQPIGPVQSPAVSRGVRTKELTNDFVTDDSGNAFPESIPGVVCDSAPALPANGRDSAPALRANPRAIPAQIPQVSIDTKAEVRDSEVNGTFSKPRGQVIRAAEFSAAPPIGSAPHCTLTFALPPPAALPASSTIPPAVPASFSPGPQARRETADQIVQAIRLTWTRGGGEALIRLDPRQFGDLSIALRVERGDVVARLQAETAEVRDWLRTNQHLLREGLAQHDLRLDRLEIAASAEERPDARDRDDERQERWRDEGSRLPQRKARARETRAAFEIVA